MILDRLDHALLYRGLSDRFARGFDYLLQFDPATPDGRVALAGDEVYASVQSYVSAPAATKSFEAHRRYCDIQCVFAGTEIIQLAPLARLKETQPYSLEGDYALYSGANDHPLVVGPREFVVLYPHEGHKPGCAWRLPEPIRKVVVKVLVA